MAHLNNVNNPRLIIYGVDYTKATSVKKLMMQFY
jgi:hypothetical protein